MSIGMSSVRETAESAMRDRVWPFWLESFSWSKIDTPCKPLVTVSWTASTCFLLFFLEINFYLVVELAAGPLTSGFLAFFPILFVALF